MFLILTDKETNKDVIYKTAKIEEKENNGNIISYLKVELEKQKENNGDNRSYSGICLILPNKDDIEERNVVILERNK